MVKARVKSIRKKPKKKSDNIRRVTTRVRKGAEHLSAFQQHVRKNMATAVLAAFAFITALIWRDAIQEIIKDIMSYLNITGTASKYKIIAALLTTLICSLGIMYFSKCSEKK